MSGRSNSTSGATNSRAGDGGSATAAAATVGSTKVSAASVTTEEEEEEETTSKRRYHPPAVPSSHVVVKPTPITQEPRLFQIGQIKRRYHAVETSSTSNNAGARAGAGAGARDERDGDDHVTSLSFSLAPSDPDFPFDLPKGLKCVLHVPNAYLKPEEGTLKKETERGAGRRRTPWLDVKNAEMGRGYQINVERGFARLVERSPGLGLLGWMKELDRGLEKMLAEDKAEVVTFIPNNNKIGSRLETGKQPEVVGPNPLNQTKKNATANSPNHHQTSYSPAQLQAAAARREVETRQIEARLGRLPLFAKSTDGIAYTIPITPRKPMDLPVPLQDVKTVKLYVPLLYPVQHCRIELQGMSRDAAKKTESGFEKRAKAEKGMQLMGHVNWLAQNMHLLATAPDPEAESNPKHEEEEKMMQELALEPPTKQSAKASQDQDDRSHVIIVPRPPEWSVPTRKDGGEEHSSDDYDSDEEDFSEDDDDDEEHGVALPTVPETTPLTNPERGISLNFPNLELYGIELLELTLLSITIKCERCKESMDISNLKTSVPATSTPKINAPPPAKPRSESCKKCASALSIKFRHELMHAHSSRAGYLDLEGCTVMDMLPSTFIPTCSECSTSLPPNAGIINVRGASAPMAICRECHRKMSFQIPEVKFLLVSSSSISTSTARTKRNPPKENLGIVAGTELPRRGRCIHYSKSYRWFRFSCCSKVYPCDRCHDVAEKTHPNEHANRMICGFCSREQNYRPDDCGICHMSVVKKAGSGFWEGGKGTRDKSRMSRKGMFVTSSFFLISPLLHGRTGGKWSMISN